MEMVGGRVQVLRSHFVVEFPVEVVVVVVVDVVGGVSVLARQVVVFREVLVGVLGRLDVHQGLGSVVRAVEGGVQWTVGVVERRCLALRRTLKSREVSLLEDVQVRLVLV